MVWVGSEVECVAEQEAETGELVVGLLELFDALSDLGLFGPGLDEVVQRLQSVSDF